MKKQYQKTKIGNIPVDWHIEKIKNIAYVDKESLSSKTNENYRFKYISLSDVDKGKINRNLLEYKFSEAPSRARRVIKKHDVLISTVRPNLKAFAYIENYVNDIIASTGFSVLTCKENYVPKFLYYVLFSHFIDSQIFSLVAGSNYPAINSSDIKNLIVPVPSLKEQEKIAEILSTWDLVIEKQQQLIEKKKEFKKGLMQRLLSGEVRFKKENGEYYPEWKLIKLGNYLIKHNEKSEYNNQYPVLTSSRKGIFLQSEYYSGNDVASDDTTGYNVVPRGYFTYRHMSDDLTFKFNINDIVDKGIVSTLYPVFTVKDMDSYFLRTKLNEGTEFKRFALQQKQGGSRTYMYFSKIETLKMNIPSLEEQKKISEVLKSADKEIELLEKELEALKLQKKGLMQRLLTGEVRVNID